MSSQSKHTAIGTLICFIVVLAWFSPWWVCGRNLAPLDILNEMMEPWRGTTEQVSVKNHMVSDAVDQNLIFRMVAAESFSKEGWFGWSSLTYGGSARYANTMALYYDWTMQLHRWFDFWTAWHLGIMGQVFLAAAGMLFFLRGRAIGILWSCCCALAYAANSQFVTWIYHRWTLSAFCWVPWIFWAIDGYRQGRRTFWILVPLFIGMGFLGGTLQHSAFVLLAVVAMWVEESTNGVRRLGPQARILGRYILWGLLGTGLAAMMFIPCIDAFLESNHLGLHIGMYGNSEMGMYPHGPLQPLANLISYPLQIFPSMLGRCDSLDVLKLFKSEMFYIAYFGSLPVLIAFLALWRKDSPKLARLLICVGLFLPLTPLLRFLYQRLFILFILGGVLAFAHFMETAERKTRLRIFKVSSYIISCCVVVWSLLSVYLVIKPGILGNLRDKLLIESKGSSFGFFDNWIALRVNHFIGDLFIWSPQQLLPLLLLIATLTGLRLTASLRTRWRESGNYIIAISILCETTLFASRWIVFTDQNQHPIYPITPEVTALQRFVGHDGRVTTMIHPSAHLARTPFVPNTLCPYGISTISGYDSIVPNGMILPNEATGDAERLGRLGVSHLITWPGNSAVSSSWKSVWESPVMSLYENTRKMPRYVGFRTDADKDKFFTGELPEILELKEITGKENSRLIDVPPGTQWVRIAENQASGWEYRENLSSAIWKPVLRAADASMVFENPNQTNSIRIEMRYNPPLRRLGFIISATSLGLLALGQLLIRYMRPQRPTVIGSIA